MTEAQRDFDLEYLDLLKQNYDNLHKSVWEAHKVSWTMTGIFVPVLVAAVGIFWKDSSGPKGNQVLLGVFIAIAAVWFWYGMLCLLDGYNKKRINQLKEIENALNVYYPKRIKGYFWPEFSQYTLHDAEEQEKCKTSESQEKWKTLKKYKNKIVNPVGNFFKALGFRGLTFIMALLLTGILIFYIFEIERRPGCW